MVQNAGRGPEDADARAARRANEPGSRGRGQLTPEEVERINAARAAAGKPPMGEDEEPTEEDIEVVEGGEPTTPTEGAAPV